MLSVVTLWLVLTANLVLSGLMWAYACTAIPVWSRRATGAPVR